MQQAKGRQDYLIHCSFGQRVFVTRHRRGGPVQVSKLVSPKFNASSLTVLKPFDAPSIALIRRIQCE